MMTKTQTNSTSNTTDDLGDDENAFGLSEWIEELRYYVNAVEHNCELADITIVINSLDAINLILDELDPECEEFLTAEAEVDEILPLWFCFWVSAWQQYYHIEPNVIQNLKSDINETHH